MLHRKCSREDAAAALQGLARGDGLARFLSFRPHHRIGPTLAARVRQLEIGSDESEPLAVSGLLDPFASACELRSQLLRRQLEEVVSLLAERGIRVCLIKGAVSLTDEPPEGYLPASVRPMEDLDIVVPPNDGDAALELIARRGWLCTSGTQQVHFSLDSPALVDVRAWTPKTPALGFLELEDFFERAASTTVGGREVRALRPQDAVQLRLSHNVIRQHLFVDFPLLDLHEMSSIIAACAGEIDWARLRSVGLMNEVARIFYAALLQLRDEFGAPVPDAAIPPPERRAAEQMRRRLDELAGVPDRLYGPASRLALIASVSGDLREKVNRAGTVLFSDPLAEASKLSAAARICLPAKMAGAHLAVWCWRLLRG